MQGHCRLTYLIKIPCVQSLFVFREILSPLYFVYWTNVFYSEYVYYYVCSVFYISDQQVTKFYKFCCKSVCCWWFIFYKEHVPVLLHIQWHLGTMRVYYYWFCILVLLYDCYVTYWSVCYIIVWRNFIGIVIIYLF